jgi:hypothetical protein
VGAPNAPPFASQLENSQIFCDSKESAVGAEKEENKLRFEVNGQMFFVNFVPEEGRWYCSAPTATGVQRIPVSIDASPFEAFAVSIDEQAKEVVN